MKKHFIKTAYLFSEKFDIMVEKKRQMTLNGTTQTHDSNKGISGVLNSLFLMSNKNLQNW